jgi:hypothetical protein
MLKNAGNIIEAKRPIFINNFLGFIGSLSTPVLDLDDTVDIVIEIRWSQPNVCWGTIDGGDDNQVYGNTTNCYLDNLRLTCSKINFEDSDYYKLKSSKLLSDGLLIGYNDYSCSRLLCSKIIRCKNEFQYHY